MESLESVDQAFNYYYYHFLLIIDYDQLLINQAAKGQYCDELMNRNAVLDLKKHLVPCPTLRD